MDRKGLGPIGIIALAGSAFSALGILVVIVFVFSSGVEYVTMEEKGPQTSYLTAPWITTGMVMGSGVFIAGALVAAGAGITAALLKAFRIR